MVELNEKQQIGFNKFMEGKNLFITGQGGCGKTTLLNKIIQYCKDNDIKIGITSSTGISATHIKGTTIHSFLKLGIGKKNIYKIYNDIKKNVPIYRKLLHIRTLIIDEISMINKYLFNKINRILQLIHRNNLTFGGIQVILSGDFCQLKPVKSDLFCFESNVWNNLNLTIIHLTKSMRQNNKEFIEMLFNLRFGNCTKKIYETLYEHCKKTRDKTFTDTEIKPTILYSNNVNVNYINNMEHNKLKTKGNAVNTYNIEYNKWNYSIEKYLKDNNIDKSIELCINDQVLIKHNIDVENGIANGTRGIITDVSWDKGVTVKLINGQEEVIQYQSIIIDEDKKEKNTLSYLPIKLAYSITIHSSQGMTIDYLSIDLGSTIFEYGQGYTGLSRSKNLDSTIITDICKKSFKCHEKVLKFYGIYTKKMEINARKRIYNWICNKHNILKS